MTAPLTIDTGRSATSGHGAEDAGRFSLRRVLSKLGPGLITGASDDDPSGIATYSQVGAQFGYALLWTMVLSYPLMAAIQGVCGRIGRVTGRGLAANLRKNYPGHDIRASSPIRDRRNRRLLVRHAWWRA